MSDMRLHKQQTGMVSILVTMLMMIIISLIVLGFAQVSRREQRQSLDSQLSSQAYYAAESGINDARSAILAMISSGGTVPAKTTCGQDLTNFPSLTTGKATISATNAVSYPCLLIDPAPKSLTYTISGTSTIVPLVSSTGSLGSGITLTWQKPTGDSGTSYTNCFSIANLGKLPPAAGAGAWGCPYGLLQADIVPVPIGSTITRPGLANSTKSVFFEPIQTASVGGGANNFSMSSSSTGSMIPAKCDDTSCVATITNLPANRYYLRINSVYKNTFGLTISSNNGAGLADAQAVIDATGKAQDVLRRVRVSVDLTDANASDLAGSAIVTQDSICKRFSVAPGYYDNDTTYPGGSDNQLCQSGSAGALTSACIAPHDIILTLDDSGSMKQDWEGITRIQELQKVADIFIDSTGVSATGNHVGVAYFNYQGYHTSDLSYNSTALKAAIAANPQANGTNYMAGLTMTSSLFAAARPGVPKIMIFISDGQNDQGGTSAQIDATTTAMKASGILVYTIGIVADDGDGALLSSMASQPPISTYYTLAGTHVNFEDFFSSISSQVTC